nr:MULTISPECIES: hypothetical protein [unclassified Marinobacter]
MCTAACSRPKVRCFSGCWVSCCWWSAPSGWFLSGVRRNLSGRHLIIGHGQTISQPYIVALMAEALELTGRERVLDIGTGSGGSRLSQTTTDHWRPAGYPGGA